VCGFKFDEFRRIKHRNDAGKCPECLHSAGRDIKTELNSGSAFDATCQEHERWSWAMGVCPEQIPEAMKNFPGSEYHPETGQLRVKSRKHKLSEMKRRGMEEYA
jgi:hypothetical protein